MKNGKIGRGNNMRREGKRYDDEKKIRQMIRKRV